MTSPYIDAPVDSLDPQRSNRVFLPPAPAAVHLHADNNLQLTVFNSVAGVELSVRLRLLLPNGYVQVSTERVVPTASRAAFTASIQTGEGWLLGATIVAAVGSPRIGQCFVVLDVVRGDNAAPIVLATVLQGYVTDSTRLAFPGSPIAPSAAGPGASLTLVGTDPAAGAEITETVPTNARWRLASIVFSLTTDVTVANREPQIVLDNGANVFGLIPVGQNQVASTAINYCGFTNAARNTIATATTRVFPIPELILQGGDRIRTITSGIVAGDNYSAPVLHFEEWIED